MTPPPSPLPGCPNDATDAGVEDLPTRPSAPVLLRFFGCGEEMLGVNGDYFTVGDTGDEDIALPPAVRGPSPCKLRFSRAAEGWRLTAADEHPYFLNQECVVGLSPLRSGDVIRLAPGGSGMQFAIVPQQAESLAKLASQYAPRLLRAAKPTDQPSAALAPPPVDPSAAAVSAEGSSHTTASDRPAEIETPASDRPMASPAVSDSIPPVPEADAKLAIDYPHAGREFPSQRSSVRGNVVFAAAMVAIGLLVGWLALGGIGNPADEIPDSIPGPPAAEAGGSDSD